MPQTSPARIGILTASDRASQGIYEDLSGKAIEDTLTKFRRLVKVAALAEFHGCLP